MKLIKKIGIVALVVILGLAMFYYLEESVNTKKYSGYVTGFNKQKIEFSGGENQRIMIYHRTTGESNLYILDEWNNKKLEMEEQPEFMKVPVMESKLYKGQEYFFYKFYSEKNQDYFLIITNDTNKDFYYEVVIQNEGLLYKLR